LVESLLQKCPNLHPKFLSEEGEALGCISGRINLDKFWQALPDPLAVKYYLSGLPIMLKTLSSVLVEHRIPPDRILTGAWE